MKVFALLFLCLALGACSKKLKEVVSPPDDVSDGHSSSQGIDITDGSSQSSLTAPPLGSSEASQSSMAAIESSASSQASSMSGDLVDSSSSTDISLGGSSSADSSTENNAPSSSSVAVASSSTAASSSEAQASSQAASSSSASFSSEPASVPHAADMFMAMCNDCHNLAEQAPFQIGANLSLAEMVDTIESTMPFRNADACTGTCAQDVAYYISEMLNGQ